jgi:hypothetical protein
MAKKKVRPAFGPPAPEAASAGTPPTGWVYRSADAPVAAPSAARRSFRERGVFERTLEVASLPFALALVAVLQPLAWIRRSHR